MRIRFVAALAIGTAILPATIAYGQDVPADLSDVVGARGSSGERVLESRGYQHVGTQTSNDSKYSTWWNEARGQCVMVRTYDGRYASIVSTLPADCDKPASTGSSGIDEVPQIIAGTNGEGEVIYQRNNCVVYYDASGYQTNSLPACSSVQVSHSDDAMASYRCEQGMDGMVAGHSGGSEEVLNLICYGEGEKPGYDVKTGYTWNRDKHRYVRETRTEWEQQEFDTFVTLQFEGDHGRIRPAKKLVPAIHSGGDHGWWTLDNVNITRDAITARYRYNGLNKPKITIDRRTGHIKVDGLSDFVGTCDNVDSNNRRF